MLAVAASGIGLWWVTWRRKPRRLEAPGPAYAFGCGALAWVLGGLVLKALAGGAVERLSGRVPEPLYRLAVGLLTGVFECGIVLLLAACLRGLRRLSWHVAVAFGIGFGAIEAAVVSIDAFFPEASPSRATGTIPLSQALTEVLAPIFERANAIPIHAFACVLVLYAVRRRRPSAFWLAFAYKTLTDGLPVEKFAAFGPWAMEFLYLPFSITGIIGLTLLARRWDAEGTMTAPAC